MARLAIGICIGLGLGVIVAAAVGIHAAEQPEPDETTVKAAADAGVDPIDLLGAVVTTGLDPYSYLYAVGHLTLPTLVVPSNSRVACIEAKESGGANIANRRGSGAVGVMQYMPSTFRAHAAEMGHPEWSPWNPAQARAVAAHDLALGRRAQWTVSGC